ncbi:MAG: DUF2141 domain-containing protein [Deltaproteobacteria bacterium]|nr:DUF2141 domain-containing protein [Deltaproteobacteria bacterium]
MIRKSLLILLFILLGITNAGGNEIKGNIHVTVEKMKNSKGYVKIRLYNSGEGFPLSGKRSLESRMVPIREGRADTLFKDLPYGFYALAVLHDENGNGKMDLKWGFYPSEGAAVSNNPQPGLVPPSFEEAKLVLDSAGLHVKIQMNY